jgi:hypothetical protein
LKHRLAALSLTLPVSALAWDAGLTLSWASEQVLRGVSVAPDTPSPGLDLTLQHEGGWQGGLSLTRLDRDAAGRRWVGVLQVGRRWLLEEDWSLLLSAAQRHYAGPPARRRFNGSEWSAQLAWRADWGLSLTHLPRQYRGSSPRADAWALELSHRLAPHGPWPLALDAGLGLLHGRGSRYAYGQLGLSWEQGGWQLSLSRIQGGAGPDDGVAATRSGGRWVAVVAWTP